MAGESTARRTIFGQWLWSEIDGNLRLSLRAFSSRSGISVPSLSRWTRFYTPGQRPELPSHKMVMKLSKTLSYKASTIQLFVDRSWAEFAGIKAQDEMLTLSPNARLLAERFDKMTKSQQRLMLRAANLSEDLGSGDEE